MAQRQQKNSFSYICFRIIRWLVKLFYPKITVDGTEYLNGEPTIIVGNHTHMNGPICGELYSPTKSTTWCAWQMMHLKEVPSYAYKDFWNNKPKYISWFYKLLSYIIAPISVCVFNNANTIPVYHDSRLMTTFKQTIDSLSKGTSVIIFPECYEPYNNIINNFQDKFVDVAKLYYKRTGKAVTFTPLYIAPNLKKMFFGKPISFNPELPTEKERERVCHYLMDTITDIAIKLPPHTVIPYANISRKEYKRNIKSEAKMRKPVVDYRNLRFSNITSPQYKHLLLLFGWVGYFILYFLTENLIPVENCYPVHSQLDDIIPFCEWFVIPYVGWYFLIIISLLYFALYNIENFKNLQKYIIITQVIAIIIYIVFPTRQDLRPLKFESNNLLTDLVGIIYSADTNTGVCPSLHVAYSLGIASTWLREKSATKTTKAIIVFVVILICLSVAFIKQHSVMDIYAAIPVCLFAEWFVFRKRKFKSKIQ